jgi:cytochrome c-type biogenesis protein CcmH/NrfG
MFFPRMRRHAKWMFVLLALVFGLGFVLFGVGAGGVGIGELLRGDGGSSGDSSSVEEARKHTEENPKDAQAWRDLATAYQDDDRATESVTALERYTELRPKDTDALRELAGLNIAKATQEQTRAQNAQLQAAVGGGSLFSNPLKLGTNQTLGTPPISQAVQEQATQVATEAIQAAQTAVNNALDAYRRLAAADPNDASIQFELAQTAQSVGETSVAIAAYKRFLKLAPDDPSAQLVREQIKQLEKPAQPSTG